MSYTIKYTNGKILALLADQSSDSISTSLTLVGKNSNAYGEAINTNFVHLLENFANRTAPRSPTTGQLWYDTAQGQVKVYSNNLWKPVGSPVISATQPTTLISGEFWFDTQGQKLWYYNGIELIDLAKPYSDFNGKNGALYETVIDEDGASQDVINFYVNDALVGWFSGTEIPLNVSANPLHTEYTNTLQPGFTLAPTTAGQYFHGTATSAISVAGFTPDQILKDEGADGFVLTSSTFMVNNAYGLVVGPAWTGNTSTVLRMYTSDTDVNIVNTVLTGKTFIKHASANTTTNFITLDGAKKSLGIFTATLPVANSIDLNSDVYVRGNLFVDGSTVDVTQLTAESPFITLGVNQSLSGRNFGLRLWADTNQLWQWQSNNNRWSAPNADINAKSGYYLYDQYPAITVNTSTGKGELGEFIETAAGLKEFSSLRKLVVGEQTDPLGRLTITTATMATTLAMFFKPGTYADFNGKQIRNVQPTQTSDDNNVVTTKDYVDNLVASATGGYGGRKPYTVSIDVTDFVNVNEEVKNYLDILLPVDGGDIIYYAQPAGARCSVLCSTYQATSATFVVTLDQNKIPYEYTVTSTNTVTNSATVFTTSTTLVTDVAGLVTVTGPRPTVSYSTKLYQVVNVGTQTQSTVVTTYVSHQGTELTVADASSIEPGAIISGNGYTQGQIVVEKLSTSTILTNRPPTGIPASGGTLTFSQAPGFKGWVYIKDLS
jgi:hypothetical protein